MIRSTNVRKIVITAVAGVFLLLAAGCGGGPNEEQIKQLEETRAAAISAEDKLEDLKRQRKQLEDKVAARQKDVDKVKAQKAATQERVNNWQGGN